MSVSKLACVLTIISLAVVVLAVTLLFGGFTRTPPEDRGIRHLESRARLKLKPVSYVRVVVVVDNNHGTESSVGATPVC